jgi:hypothetical protein
VKSCNSFASCAKIKNPKTFFKTYKISILYSCLCFFTQPMNNLLFHKKFITHGSL